MLLPLHHHALPLHQLMACVMNSFTPFSAPLVRGSRTGEAGLRVSQFINVFTARDTGGPSLFSGLAVHGDASLGTESTLGNMGKLVSVAFIPTALAPFQAWNENNTKRPTSITTVPNPERKQHTWNENDATEHRKSCQHHFHPNSVGTVPKLERKQHQETHQHHHRSKPGTKTTHLAYDSP